jgi:3-hydroxybutyryl-CoA dehydrogenase
MARELKTVGVVGLGTMGAGIAEVFARNGLSVVGVERDDESAERGRGHIQHSTDRAVKRGKLSEADQQALFDRITFATSLDTLADCDLVVEAVLEHLDLKRDIFAALDKIVREDAILATNTSSLSVTEISVATERPRRVVGMHFFNPAPVQEFVEVIRTVVTEPDVVDDVSALAQRLGKSPVVAQDRAGFIANALLFGYLNHAVSMFEQHYATREDLDAAMRLGCGYPMGPLALLDLIGLDTAYEILDTMYKQGRNRLHAPAPILKQMVTAGLLGRKTGRGFYAYEAPDSPVVVDDELTPAASSGTQGRPIRKVGVVGSGTMAVGIVEVCAKAGYDVLYVARGQEKVDRVRAGLERSLEKAVQRGKLTSEERDAALTKISGTSKLDDLAGVDLVIEAVVEELSVKQALFETFDEICKPGTVLATTTSSLPVIDLAMATQRPADVVGLHFFNPAPVMKLVEVVSTVSTSPEVAGTAAAFSVALGKHPVRCGDRAGFIVNALLFPYLNDAVRMLEAHYASVDDIDTAMKLGCRLPMGPFELLDVVGLDVSLAIQRTLYLEFREPGFAPAPLLEHLVTAGYLGRKTNRGFRDYS